jgi:hypothetical protein
LPHGGTGRDVTWIVDRLSGRVTYGASSERDELLSLFQEHVFNHRKTFLQTPVNVKPSSKGINIHRGKVKPTLTKVIPVGRSEILDVIVGMTLRHVENHDLNELREISSRCRRHGILPGARGF